MNKTILFGAVVLSLLALFGYKSNAQLKEENNTVKNETPKILIAYYSYSGNTKEVAEAIHKLVGAPVVSPVPGSICFFPRRSNGKRMSRARLQIILVRRSQHSICNFRNVPY